MAMGGTNPRDKRPIFPDLVECLTNGARSGHQLACQGSQVLLPRLAGSRARLSRRGASRMLRVRKT